MATVKRISIQMPLTPSSADFDCTASPPPTRTLTEKTSTYSPTVSPSRILLSSTSPSKSVRSSALEEMAVPPVTPHSERTARSTRLFYYKTGTKFYLHTGSSVRVSSGANSAARSGRRAADSAGGGTKAAKPRATWASGDADHRLRLMDYHMAELSLHYRSASYLSTSRTAPEEAKETQEATAEAEAEAEDDKVSLPPPPSPSVTSPRTLSSSVSIVASSSVPSRPLEPQELVHQSTSNRLLNYVSIDECPIKHRRARRRVRSSLRRPRDLPEPSPPPPDIPEDSIECVSLSESPLPPREPSNAILDRIDRLQGLGAANAAGGANAKVRRQFQKRNQLLRDQMNVYVAWRTSERLRERFDLMRGIHSANSLLAANKEQRLKAFSAVLRQKEMEYSAAAGSEENGEESEALEREEEIGETPRGEENKLTRLWQILQ